MPVQEPAIAIVDRYYDIEPEWSALPREWYGDVEPAEWSVYIEPPLNPDVKLDLHWFDDVEAALGFAREHAAIVLVRLGSREDTIYSAGSVRANQFVDGSGLDYPEWPPDGWPDYRGPGHDPRAVDPADLAASRERRRKARGLGP